MVLGVNTQKGDPKSRLLGFWCFYM